jgi:hypothetical protein
VLCNLKYLSLQKPAVPSVLRIHDILVWDPDQGSRIHASDKWIRIFLLITVLFEGTFAVHNFSKIKSKKEVAKQ